MKWTKLLIPLILICLTLNLQAIKYPVINYQTSDGLPQNQVNALIQDSMGYIFVGTQSGIGVFNGISFDVITRKDGLSNNFINGFAIDNKENLWVATQEGLSKIDRNNHITTYMGSTLIHSLHYDKTNQLLWIIAANGIYYLQENRQPQKLHLPTAGFVDPKDPITGISIDSAGEKYFFSRTRLFRYYQGKTRIISPGQRIRTVKWLPTLKRIVLGYDNELLLLDKTTNQLVPFIKLPAQIRPITDVAEDHTGKLWVSTNSGLLLYKTHTHSPIHISTENGLLSKYIRTILLDRENTLFIGTYWGLSQISQLITMYVENDGLPHKFVWAFIEDRGKVLITGDRGILQLDPETNTLTPFKHLNKTLSELSFRTITKLADQHFLLGTRNNGIYRWDGARQFKQINKNANIYSALKTPDNVVWYGTDNGLLKYDGKKFTSYIKGIKDKYVYSLALYNANTLLLGTGKGLQHFYLGKFVDSEIAEHTKGMLINDIYVDSAREVLIATELNGLFIYKDKTLQQLTKEHGLLHDDVWSVIKDNSGNIWLNTSASLACYTNGFFSHYNKRTGLIGDEGNMHAVFKSQSGDLYFGIVPGFIKIPAQNDNNPYQNPVLHVKEVKVNGTSISHEANSSMLLAHNKNSLDFQYIAVTTRKENPVYYKTRLLPFDESWSEPTRETHIKYLNLPPDDYVFEVIANNGGSGDDWFKSLNGISFTIKKPYWLKWWFILFLVAFGTLLVLFFIKLRLKALERQKKHLQKLVEERTKELEYLSITDPLTDLKNRRYLEDQIKKDISQIKRSIYDNRALKPEDRTPLQVLGVFILDIDHFKQVNDQYGHKAGDIVIVEIARLLLEKLRDSDTIVRWGGEEFLIITWQKSVDKSFELAERIRQRIEEYQFVIANKTSINKTVSVGFAHFPFISDDIETVNWSHVVSLADSALYLAKNNGRNQSVGICRGDNPIDTEMDVKSIVSDITEGVRRNYLKIVTNKKSLEISQHKK